MITTYVVPVDASKNWFGYYLAGLHRLTIDDVHCDCYEVATSTGERILFINPIAQLLPNNLKVIALNGNDYGIRTIGDIKSAIARFKINTQYPHLKFRQLKSKHKPKRIVSGVYKLVSKPGINWDINHLFIGDPGV